MQSFNAWVREVRLSKRLTQTECAKRAGMLLSHWNQYEIKDAKRTRATVEAMARGLDVPAEVALAAAGYLSNPALESEDAPGAVTIEWIGKALPREKRQLYWKLLHANARAVSNALQTD